MIRLQSSALQVDVLPEVGGKIGQIRYTPSGYDLLIPPQRPYLTIPTDGDWLKHDTSGMDDCFPNVAAGAYPEPPWTSAKLPDLGEWTHSEWSVRHFEPTRVAMGEGRTYTTLLRHQNDPLYGSTNPGVFI